MGDTVAEHIAALTDDDWAIREEAASMLGTLRDPRAVGPLVSLLRDSDRAVREAAIGALTAIGTASVPVLGLCLSDPQAMVQEAASTVLASIADERVLIPLLNSLKNSDWIVRMQAVRALGRIKEQSSIEHLIPLLQDKVKAVREETSTALATIGEAALPALQEAIQHEDWLVRLHAVEALGKTKSAYAVEPLLTLLFNDRDSAVREDAVRALGEIGDPQAVGYLFTVMKEPGLRVLAIEALGHIGDRRAVPVLLEAAKGTNQPDGMRTVSGCGDQWTEGLMAQAAAVRALGMMKDDTALPTLVGALQSTFTRAEAAAALARFGSKAIPLLLPLLAESHDDNIRYHVKETLTAAGWRSGRI